MRHPPDRPSCSRRETGTLDNSTKKGSAVACARLSRKAGTSNCTRGKAGSVGRGCTSLRKGRGHRDFVSYRSTALDPTCSTAEIQPTTVSLSQTLPIVSFGISRSPPPPPNEFRRRSASHDHCDHYLLFVPCISLLFCYLTPSSFFVLVHLLISIIYKSSTVPNGSLPKYNYLIENREKTLSIKGC
jgi:hypothetical protein